RVVPLRRRVLHVRRRNRENLRRVPAPLRLRRLRHLVVGHVGREPLVRRYLRQRRRQRRLPVVHVPDRPHVHMRLGPLKLSLGHNSSKSFKNCVEKNRGEKPWGKTVKRLRSPSTPLLYVFSLRRSLDALLVPKLATGIEPVTSSLPRTRSTD